MNEAISKARMHKARATITCRTTKNAPLNDPRKSRSSSQVPPKKTRNRSTTKVPEQIDIGHKSFHSRSSAPPMKGIETIAMATAKSTAIIAATNSTELAKML